MVHVNQKSQRDENESIFEVNCNGTARLAEQAVLAGVKRFIFISSIGVNGTTKNEAFSETDALDQTTLMQNPNFAQKRNFGEFQKRQVCRL